MKSSNSRNAPPVSSALAFIVSTPPPQKRRCSPSPAARTIETAPLISSAPSCNLGASRSLSNRLYHNGMHVPYEETGRVNQKLRTRDALIAATRELLAQGVTPTMEGAAAAAAISRTTAYRYFPNLRALLVAAYPHIEQRSLLGPEPPQDPAARLAIVAEDQTLRVLKYEPEMRAVLRLSLEADSAGGPKLPMNRGLRIGWIEDALTPLR